MFLVHNSKLLPIAIYMMSIVLRVTYILMAASTIHKAPTATIISCIRWEVKYSSPKWFVSHFTIIKRLLLWAYGYILCKH